MLALLTTLVGLFGLLQRLWPALRDAKHGDELLTAASLSVFVGLASGLVDGTLVMPATQIQFALVFGLMLGRLATARSGSLKIKRPHAFARIAMASAILGAALALCLHALSTYRVQASERAAFQQRFPGQWLVPRFWENGLTLTRDKMPGRD